MKYLVDVSIPHRYGKNGNSNYGIFETLKRFPFLIGTVRTLKKPSVRASRSLFPFLIGTVRTQIGNALTNIIED